MLFLTSCAALGSKTMFKSETPFEFKDVGYTTLFYSNELNKIFPNSDKLFFKAIQEECKRNVLDTLQYFEQKINYFTPSKEEIISLCLKHNLKGLIVPNLKFIGVTQSVYFIPIGKYIDTEVELKLYDSNGNLVINTRHKTMSGNSYAFNPTTDMTIRDGATGALRKLLKEYRLLKK